MPKNGKQLDIDDAAAATRLESNLKCLPSGLKGGRKILDFVRLGHNCEDCA